MTKIEKNKIKTAMRVVFEKYNRLAEKAIKDGDKELEEYYEAKISGAYALERALIAELPEICL